MKTFEMLVMTFGGFVLGVLIMAFISTDHATAMAHAGVILGVTQLLFLILVLWLTVYHTVCICLRILKKRRQKKQAEKEAIKNEED